MREEANAEGVDLYAVLCLKEWILFNFFFFGLS